MDSPLRLRGDQLPRAGALLDIGIETLRILAVVPPLGLRLGLTGRSAQTRGGWLWLGDDTLDIGRGRAWHNTRIPVRVGWVVRRRIVGGRGIVGRTVPGHPNVHANPRPAVKMALGEAGRACGQAERGQRGDGDFSDSFHW